MSFFGWPILLLLGLTFGSFLNVLIHRLPRMVADATGNGAYNLFVPRSHCAHCAKPIQVRDNIPIFSWLWLGGRTRCCDRRITLRYPCMELFGGLLFVWTFFYFGEDVLIAILTGIGLGLAVALCVQFLEFRYLSRALLYVLLWYGLLLPTVDSALVHMIPAHVYLSVSPDAWMQTQILSVIVGLMSGVVLRALLDAGTTFAWRESMPALMGATGAWFGWIALPLLAGGVVLGEYWRTHQRHSNRRMVYGTIPAPHRLRVVRRIRHKVALTHESEGEDCWRAWEFGWLAHDGRRRCGVVQIRVPADSSLLIESKSLKLYLFSLRNESFHNTKDLSSEIKNQLSARVHSPLSVEVLELSDPALHRAKCVGVCLDQLNVPSFTGTQFAQASHLLRNQTDTQCSEVLYTHLFRTLCPLTGQPDWATVRMHYSGCAIDRHGLLRYLLCYAEHNDFHEHCIENIFGDIWYRCRPDRLLVEGFFLRRGGIDICPRRFSRNDYLDLRSPPRPLMRQ